MANVKLSTAEMELVCNADFILTKNAIIEKVYQLFGELSGYYMNEIKQFQLPEEITAASPKISKGENYEGLPWVMLDYPRYYTKDAAFGIRIFFWWGNFFSITLQTKGMLQLKGEWLKDCSDWYLCVHENEWQHHFREDNYQPLSSFSEEQINAMPFIKLAKKIPLEKWDIIQINMEKYFNQLLQLTTQPVK